MPARLVSIALLLSLAAPSPGAAARERRASGDPGAVVRGDLGARIDAYLTRAVPFGFSGTVLVADASGIVLHRGYGLADRGRGVPMTTETVFDMGSITKAFTATAILVLEADGKLSTADTLARYFDGVPADKAAITLDQILTHTSGLVDLTGGDYDVVTRERLVRDVLAKPLLAPPGAKWSYSNAGYSLLAAIVEKVTGLPYERFMRERLFEPAGMRHTGYRLPDWDPARVARTYVPPVDHGTPLERLRRVDGPHWILLGNGGMLTTSADLYRWELALREGRIVPPAVQERLFAPRVQRSETVSQGYAWTVERTEGDKVMVHHGGDAPGLGVNAEHRRYPAEGVTIVFLGNTRHKGYSARRSIVPGVRRVLTGVDPPAPPAVVPLAPRRLARYEGTYAVEGGGELVVRAERDRLAVGANGQAAIDLFTFNRAATSLSSRRDLNARAQSLADALVAGDARAAEQVMGSERAAARLVGAVRAAEGRHGPLRAARVLGTARMDRGKFRTSLELAFERRAMVVRFAWGAGRPEMESDDYELPKLGGMVSVAPSRFAFDGALLHVGGERFVDYDLMTDQTVEVTFGPGSGSRAGDMTIHLPSGAVDARRMP
jgi:CubicO group peptidase (beta-lactamase class C family)